MACTPDPEDSWPLWSIATHELKSPDPRVPSDAGTRRDKEPRARRARQGGPCSSSKSGRRGQQGASDRTSSARPDSRGDRAGQSTQREAACCHLVPKLRGTHRTPRLSYAGDTVGPGSPLFCTRSRLEQPLWFVPAFSQVRSSRGGQSRPELLHAPGGVFQANSVPIPRLRALPFPGSPHCPLASLLQSTQTPWSPHSAA